MMPEAEQPAHMWELPSLSDPRVKRTADSVEEECTTEPTKCEARRVRWQARVATEQARRPASVGASEARDSQRERTYRLGDVAESESPL